MTNCFELTGAVTDAVVEQNTFENADVGIKVESSVTGPVVRENKMINVDVPLFPGQ